MEHSSSLIHNPIAENISKTPDMIGNYLVRAGLCSEKDILKAVARQGVLKSSGDQKKIGDILLDMALVSPKDLSGGLQQQSLDRFASSGLFQYLDRSALIKIYSNSKQQGFDSGEIIFRQNEKSRFVAVILRGTINLVHTPKQGRDIDLQVLKSGESFGEMGLLSNQLRLVTAKCIEPTELLIIPGELFKEIYHQHPKFSQAAIRKWFTNIVSDQHQSSSYQDTYYKELLSEKETMPCVQMMGVSKTAKALQSAITDATNSDRPLLLIGQKGTMRSRVAQLIYESSGSIEGPYIVFDPEKIPKFVFHTLDSMISTEFQTELSQIGALFGYGKIESHGSGAPWQGFLKMAQNGILVVNGVDLLERKVQRLLAQFLKTGLIYPVNCDRPANASVRIVITAEDELNLIGELYECFQETTIRIPSVQKRKRDLKKISERMIEEISSELGIAVSGIEQEAMNIIMAYDWPGNFRELEGVLKRGVSLAKRDILSAEEIYVGRVSITGKNAYNLLKVPAIKHFFSSPFFPKVPQIAIALMFMVVVAMGIWGNPSPQSNVSTLLIWANWEPLLIISCFILARIWCSLCPIGFLGEMFQKIRRKRVKVPPKYLKYGFFISAIGLAIVFWSQAVFDMFHHPKETAGLLLAMIISAVIFAFFFEERVWCRYVCPLGQMVATFARVSIVEIRSNYNYCSHECATYNCYSGNDETSGCKLAKGPFALETNQNCNLCGNCIKLCPHESVRLNLRPPGWELLHARSADLAVLLFVPLLWGTQIFRSLETTVTVHNLGEFVGSMALGYAIIMAACTLFAYVVTNVGRISLGDLSKGKGAISNSVYVLAMLPVIYANEIALRLTPLLNHAADFFVILGNQVGYEFPIIAFRLNEQSIQILQILLLIISIFISIHVLGRYLKLSTNKNRVFKYLMYAPFVTVAGISIYFF